MTYAIRKVSGTKKRTARVNGIRVDVDRLIALAAEFPESTRFAEDFLAFRSHDRGWLTSGGESIGPKHIVDLAEKHQADYGQMMGAQPTWIDHIQRVRDADLDAPILMTEEGAIIDGAHRVTKMFVEHRGEIRVRRISENMLAPFRIEAPTDRT